MKTDGTAYYARRGSLAADFWTLLHPPYTAWNLAYVIMGSALAPTVNWLVLAIMLLAFFCGTGIAAHALDELYDRPLRTNFSDGALKFMAAGSLALALALGGLLVQFTSPLILILFGIGVFYVLAYNLEWWNGLFHTDLGFALSWGAFPFLVGNWSQTESLTVAAFVGAVAATLLSLVQRALSTPARFVRRKVSTAGVTFSGGEAGDVIWDKGELLATWEKPLRLLSWVIVLLAFSLLVTKI